MTAATLDATPRPMPRSSSSTALLDTIAITWRNLIAYVRVPESLFFSSIQPIMFVLLFRYVFGGAIAGLPNGVRYVDYLMPGIFVQTLMFGAIGTSIGLAEDLQKGLIERFRSLPMARSAVLAGRGLADLVRNVLVFILMTVVGMLVGFRLHGGVPRFIFAALIALAFAYALSWVFAIVGLSAPNSETAQLMSFPVLFPLTFASSAFVPVGVMPGWLQAFADRQPVSIVIDAIRGLCLGHVDMGRIVAALIWSAAIAVVFAPLAVMKYRRTS
jgi:ABC-2 type transport system permease protein/oleandomycin transport system permease protein